MLRTSPDRRDGDDGLFLFDILFFFAVLGEVTRPSKLVPSFAPARVMNLKLLRSQRQRGHAAVFVSRAGSLFERAATGARSIGFTNTAGRRVNSASRVARAW